MSTSTISFPCARFLRLTSHTHPLKTLINPLLLKRLPLHKIRDLIIGVVVLLLADPVPVLLALVHALVAFGEFAQAR